MKRFFVWVVLGVGSYFVAMGDSSEARFQSFGISGGGNTEEMLSTIAHLNDGERYAVAMNGNRKIVAYSYKDGEKKEVLFDVSTATNCPFASFEGFELSEDEQKILFYTQSERRGFHSFVANYYVYDRISNRVIPVSDGGKQQYATLSPDGRMVAFARDNNLYLTKLDYETESPITRDGKQGEILNGVPSLLYEEAFKCRGLMVWAPDNSYLAYLKTDEQNLPFVHLYSPKSSHRFGGDSLRYAYAGGNVPKVTLHLYNVSNKKLTQMELPVEEDGYVPRLVMDRYANRLLVMTLNREQNLLNMYSVNPKSGVARPLIKEKDRFYIDINSLDMFRVLPNGILMASERSGYRHLYLLKSNGLEDRPITSGMWEVTRILDYDEKSQTIYYQSNEGDASQRKVYSINFSSKKKLLTSTEGVNEMSFSKNFKYAFHSFSNFTTSPCVEVCKSTGESIRPLGDNTLSLPLAGSVPHKEICSFVDKNGDFLAKGWMIKPIDFKASKEYPVVILQKNGIDRSLALREWHSGLAEYLASNGFVVFYADMKGVSGKGAEWRNAHYLHLGDSDVREQILLANALSNVRFVDSKRISIVGENYGGYLVLMAMSKGKGIFRSGVAVNAFTDLSKMNGAISERWMHLPKENYQAYEEASALSFVPNFKGKLLWVNGGENLHASLPDSPLYLDSLRQIGKEPVEYAFPAGSINELNPTQKEEIYKLILRFFQSPFIDDRETIKNKK